MRQTHESEEMYLETILLLSRKNGHVRSVDVASELGYSKPSVSGAMKKLKAKGYVTIGPDGRIELSPEGAQAAFAVYEKHHLITKLLVKIGADPAMAEENACRIEHVISKELLEVIRAYVEETHLHIAV